MQPGTYTSAEIRQIKIDNPSARERDIAAQCGISEVEYVAAWLGHSAIRITTDFDRIFPKLQELGVVMALTRNENAVHEKIGVYDRYIAGNKAAMMLGEQIDTRMFPSHWVYGFAVENALDGGVKRSFQFFDAQGQAVHKIHLRPESDTAAWKRLANELALDDQAAILDIKPPVTEVFANDDNVPLDELRQRWTAMTDTHQFVGLLSALKLSRLKAISSVGDDYAWRVSPYAVQTMFSEAVRTQVPLMCFVANQGCVQIHSGPVGNVKTVGPWLNIMDETFHLHLREDRINECWVVRKPTDKGHVTSVEAYDAKGDLIIQFFGKRIEGEDERKQWRAIVEALPMPEDSRAA
ncbi:ChuX/HutX family heme-like substrate-binding protein [Rhizobium sp.]|uniref:hemin-degrading factor n=1 Tax=Rhizobium sp. TaxID=391 RepID=UPI000E7EE91B|nr:hemin-degrading factor [Rhizobium sp.]